MNLPNEEQWSRIYRLVEELDEVPLSDVPTQIQALEEAGEDRTVLSYIRLNYQIPALPQYHPGDRIADRYTLEEVLGQGGMGVVYQAVQDRTGQRVAVKLIHPTLVSEQMTRLFNGEIQILGRLDHPGIVRIFDAGIHTERGAGREVLFFAMERIQGETLLKYCQREAIAVVEKLRLFREVLAAVQYAHDAGIIHRDLKPQNILVRSNGTPVILDFGLAQMNAKVWTGQVKLGDPGSEFSLEPRPGGTMGYMAPEQFSEEPLSLVHGQAVDVYALGVILFELLTGRKAFAVQRDQSFTAIRERMETENLPLLEDFIECHPELSAVLRKATARVPENRYLSASDFAKALTRFLRRRLGVSLDEPAWAPAEGERVPETNWRLERRLGGGGMGEVWLAAHDSLPERRVFKFCTQERHVNTLKREYSLFRLLKHRVGENTHFVRLFGLSLEDPPYYLMMEYVPALSLPEWFQAQGGSETIAESIRLNIVIQAARALQEAHEAGVLHRDVKPSNILVRGDLSQPRRIHVYVTDFGIGQTVNQEALLQVTRLAATYRSALNHPESGLAGTLTYLAPELHRGGEPSIRSDIYSLGVVLFQMLVGDLQRPVTPDSYEAIRDPLLVDDLRRCLAEVPDKRFQSLGQLASNLKDLEQRRVQHAQRQREVQRLERRAYWKGVIRTAVVGGLILAVIVSMAVFAFVKENQELLSRTQADLKSLAIGRKSAGFEQLKKIRRSFVDPFQYEKTLIEVMALSDLDEQSFLPETILAADIADVADSMDVLAYVNPSGKVAWMTESSGHWRDAGVLPIDDETAVSQLRLSGSGRRLAVVVRGDRLHLWSLEGEEPRRVLAEAMAPGSDLAFSPDERWIAFGSDGGRVLVYSAVTGEFQSMIWERGGIDPERIQTRLPACIRFSPDARHIAVSSRSSLNVGMFETRTGDLEMVVTHPQPVRSLDWASNGELATACENGWVYFWRRNPQFLNEATTKSLALDQARESIHIGDDPLRSITLHRELQWMAVVPEVGPPSVHKFLPEETLASFRQIPDLSRMKFSEDRRMLIAYRKEAVAATWRLHPSDVHNWVPTGTHIASADFSPKDPLLAVSGQYELALFHSETFEELDRFPSPQSHRVVFDPETGNLYTSARQSPVVYERWTQGELFGFEKRTHWFDGLRWGDLAVGADGRTRVFSEGTDISVFHDRTRLMKFSAGDPVETLDLSHDSRWVGMRVQGAPSIRFYRIDSDVPVPLSTSVDGVSQVCFHPGTNLLATVTQTTVSISSHDASGFTPLTHWDHDYELTSVVWSPAGLTVAVADTIGTIHIHSMEDPRHSLELPSPSPLPIRELVFGPGGTVLLALNENNYFQSWNLKRLALAIQDVIPNRRFPMFERTSEPAPTARLRYAHDREVVVSATAPATANNRTQDEHK